jgi:2-(1,2-epoxy-1,2-dihydrophenyl)acetyl-CoA isomerase
MRDAMIELLAAADTDPGIRAVAIRANGRHFCSGADVASIAAARRAEPMVGDGMRRILQGAQRLVAAVFDCPKPVVAVVQGTAAGLGAHLAYASDLVVAAEEASFLEPSCFGVSSWTRAAPTCSPVWSACNGRRS